MYCECFAQGINCGKDCECFSCFNEEVHNGVVLKAKKSILKRNPLAFKKKINEKMNEHAKGCTCKKSGC